MIIPPSNKNQDSKTLSTVISILNKWYHLLIIDVVFVFVLRITSRLETWVFTGDNQPYCNQYFIVILP